MYIICKKGIQFFYESIKGICLINNIDARITRRKGRRGLKYEHIKIANCQSKMVIIGGIYS